MNPVWNTVISLSVYVIIAIASYLMGRLDEQKKWGTLFFNHWRMIVEAQYDMEKRIMAILVVTRRQ